MKTKSKRVSRGERVSSCPSVVFLAAQYPFTRSSHLYSSIHFSRRVPFSLSLMLNERLLPVPLLSPISLISFHYYNYFILAYCCAPSGLSVYQDRRRRRRRRRGIDKTRQTYAAEMERVPYIHPSVRQSSIREFPSAFAPIVFLLNAVLLSGTNS